MSFTSHEGIDFLNEILLKIISDAIEEWKKKQATIKYRQRSPFCPIRI